MATGTSGAGHGNGLEEMMEQLGLKEEHLDDVIFKEENPSRLWLHVSC